MGRIRTVKPELFRHEILYDLEKETDLPIRVSWIGIFTVCDREGRFRWRPRALKSEILPYDNIDFELILDALHDANLIHKYAVNLDEFGCVPSWKQHQVINVREAQSILPAPAPGIMLPAKMTRHIPQHIKMHVHARDKGMCCTCKSFDHIQFDHIVPISKGGLHTIENIRLLCRSCNIRKSDRLESPTGLLDEESTVHAHASIVNPVHARGEGKGKEGKGKGKEGKEGNKSEIFDNKPESWDNKLRNGDYKPKTQELESSDEDSPPLGLWSIFQMYWKNKYNRDPVRNAKINAQLKQLSQRIPQEEHEKLIQFYLKHQKPYYVQNMHGVGPLLADCEALVAQMRTGIIANGVHPISKSMAIKEHNDRIFAEAFAKIEMDSKK